jgi:RHS repeat-associated protein
LNTTEPSGLVHAYTFDGLSQMVRETTAGVRATVYEYDAAGRRTTTTRHTVNTDGTLSAALTTEKTAYDGVGNVVKTTSAEGRTTAYGIDAGGQTTSVTQTSSADPGTVVQAQLGYDAAGNRTRMVDGEGRATDYTYTSWGQLESTIEPETPGQTAAADRTWTTRYDKAGQAVSETSPGAVSRVLIYDGLGRLTDETGAGAEATTTARHLEYDAAGQLTRLLSPGTDYQFAWYDRGLLKSSTGAAGTTSYEYNANGDMSRRSGPNGTLDIGYDGNRRQKTLTDSLTGRTQTMTYNATGELASTSYGSASRSFTYDNLGRVATDAIGSSTISYIYDRDDLVTSKTTSGYRGAGSNSYQHDALGRLTYWSDADGSVTTYGYDKASNRTSVTSGGTTRAQAFDARNRLKTDSQGATYAWTARGTLASSTAGGTTTTYASDAFDRLRTVTKPGHVSQYDYDSLDRVASYGGLALAYDGLGLEPTTLPGNTVVSRDPDGVPLAVKTGSGAGLETVADRHDDVVATVNGSTGALVGSASYNPDGVTGAGSDTLPVGFQGSWGDNDFGLVNAEARWYSPSMAGFASRDSYDLGADPVTQTNRYAYGGADPITYDDPSGHCPCLAPVAVAPELLITAGVGIGIYAVAKYAQTGNVSMPSISMPHFSMPSWLSGNDSVPHHAPARAGTASASQAKANAEAANRAMQAQLAQYTAQSAAQLAQLQQTLGQMNALYDKMWADELKLQAIKQRTAQKLALLEALKAENARQVAAIERQNKADNAALAHYYASVAASRPTSTVQRPESTTALTPGQAAIGTGITVAEPMVVNANSYDDDIAAAAAAAGAIEAEAYAATHRPDDDDDDDSCEPVSYKRPSGFRKGVRDKAFENNKDVDGQVYDAVTKRIINKDDPWQMGHLPGHEFRKLVQSAKAQKWSRERFLDEVNNFERYRPEMPLSNMCHEGEDMTDFYWGP